MGILRLPVSLFYFSVVSYLTLNLTFEMFILVLICNFLSSLVLWLKLCALKGGQYANNCTTSSNLSVLVICTGYVVQGSNGEYTLLTTQERVEMVKKVRQLISPDKLLIAGSACECK